jgi:hypothetical protein
MRTAVAFGKDSERDSGDERQDHREKASIVVSNHEGPGSDGTGTGIHLQKANCGLGYTYENQWKRDDPRPVRKPFRKVVDD